MSSLPVLGLMNQRIALRKHVFTDDTSFYHENMLGAPQTYPARVEYRHSLSYGSNDTSLSSCATVYTTADVGMDDEIILPDGTIRSVLSVDHAVDGNGMFSHSIVTV